MRVPRSEESAGEVGRRDMVSAVLLSPDGEEQQLWWLLQTPGCGTPALRGCRSAAPPLGRVCAERWAPQRGSALHLGDVVTHSRGLGAEPGGWLLTSMSRGFPKLSSHLGGESTLS